MRFCCSVRRVEIIRLSDKSFKETIKDVELSSYRSTTKEGYVSLDPSKPLPHEFEEGKLSRYNENMRQKYATNNELSEKQRLAAAAAGADGEEDDLATTAAVDHEENIVSQYANDSVLLNKTEFREILMNALAGNGSSHRQKFNNRRSRWAGAELNKAPPLPPQSPQINADENDGAADAVVERPLHDDLRKIVPKSIITSEASLAAGEATKKYDIVDQKLIENQTTSSDDEIIYPNETIIKATHLSTDIERKTSKPISLDAPEVDKLLNEGNNLLSKHFFFARLVLDFNVSVDFACLVFQCGPKRITSLNIHWSMDFCVYHRQHVNVLKYQFKS